MHHMLFVILLRLTYILFCLQKELLLAIVLIFGWITLILITRSPFFLLMDTEEEESTNSTVARESCMTSCFLYTVVMIILGIIPYVLFSLMFRELRRNIRPRQTSLRCCNEQLQHPFTASRYSSRTISTYTVDNIPPPTPYVPKYTPKYCKNYGNTTFPGLQ